MGMVVLKNAIPSAPIVTVAPLLESVASAGSCCTYASPVTKFHCAPGVAWTRIYQFWPGLNCWLCASTNPLEPACADA